MVETGNQYCYTHGWEVAAGTCRVCTNPFCSACLVYAFGAKKPPYCISCAVAAGGLRSTAGNRAMPAFEEPARPPVDASGGDKVKKPGRWARRRGAGADG